MEWSKRKPDQASLWHYVDSLVHVHHLAGTKLHNKKKASWQRQSDALGNVWMWNFGCWHSQWCYLNAQVEYTPSWQNGSLIAIAFFIHPATLQTGMVWGSWQRVYLASKFPRNRFKLLWDVLGKLFWSMEAPPLNLQILILMTCKVPDSTRRTESMPLQVRAVLIAQGDNIMHELLLFS